MAGGYTFDIAAFRVSFPAFSNVATYPDATLTGYWDVAVLYIANSNYGYLSGDARYRALVHWRTRSMRGKRRAWCKAQPSTRLRYP
jgi:hypothetical protein